MMNVEAEIQIVENQYVVRVQIGDTSVRVYLDDETGVVETPNGGYGIEVDGPWFKFRKSKAEIERPVESKEGEQ